MVYLHKTKIGKYIKKNKRLVIGSQQLELLAISGQDALKKRDDDFETVPFLEWCNVAKTKNSEANALIAN